MRDIVSTVVFAGLLIQGTLVNAQLSTLLREGIEAVAKGSTKAAVRSAREGIEAAAPKVSSILTRNVTADVVEGAARASSGVAKGASQFALSAIAKHGDEVCRPVVAQFGDDGARALAAVSSESAAKLAKMAPDLAKNPKSSEWIGQIVTGGDKVVSWLWEKRLSIAVGTTATAVLMQPEKFLEAGEHVATTAISAAGEHLVEPMIAETASHVMEPLVREISKPLVTQVLPVVALLSAVLAGLMLAWLCWSGKRFVKS